ncbi:MAG: DUF58 domain-containing protein [Burkholderiaceae bacterium]
MTRSGLAPESNTAGSDGESLFARFIPRRGPIAGDHLLTRRNIYVLPSKTGLLFGAVLLAMLVCSINYGLAMGYALTFLIFGLAVVGMMHTFRNLSAITLRAGKADPVFAGQMAEVSFMALNPSRLSRFAILIDTPGMNQTESVDIAPQTEHLINIALPAGQRGWMMMPRLTLSTRYPLGIWRAWSYWQPAQRVLVYPEPENPPLALPATRLDNGDGQGDGGLEEDLAGIRPFQEGDSPRRIAWTAIARTGTDELISKHFDGGGTGELNLDFQTLPAGLDIETRLSRLTRWVLSAEASGCTYALSLPGNQLPPGNGPGHQTACLRALATFQLPAPGHDFSGPPGRQPA